MIDAAGPDLIRIRLLIASVNAEGVLNGVWAVRDRSAVPHSYNMVRQQMGTSDLSLCTIGDLLAQQTLRLAAELDGVGNRPGPAELPPRTKDFRSGIAAAAAVARHRGVQLKGWQP